MSLRYAWHAVLDWIDRNAELLPLIVMIAVLFGFAVLVTGWPS